MTLVKSAGLLMFRRAADGEVEVLLAHPGGPFWARKDAGAWTIPERRALTTRKRRSAAAKREFVEETGFAAIEPFIALGSLKQPSGKWISIWAFESDCDPGSAGQQHFRNGMAAPIRPAIVIP